MLRMLIPVALMVSGVDNMSVDLKDKLSILTEGLITRLNASYSLAADHKITVSALSSGTGVSGIILKAPSDHQIEQLSLLLMR